MNKMKILIADDNQSVRRLVRDHLPATVDEVFECADGDEVFEMFECHQPDWILMDWQMPKMDGITATRQIIANFPAAKICLVTSFDDDDLKREALRAGAIGFVIKDDLFELSRVLKEV